ncbi:MAG: PAS domain S-box protein, partial [Methylococcaceae bacterium]|nr:PAS domain S-box protein [Methylococcaceae bacterium]
MKAFTLPRISTASLRSRLVLSVAAVHAVMMALFIGDLTLRQRDLLLQRQIDEATTLSHTLATSSAGWIAATDLAGLQELVDAQRRYPELSFALLTDLDGRVLADTERTRVGRHLLDLPRHAVPTRISVTPQLVDIAVPASVGDRQVGWARVGVGQAAAGEKLTRLIHAGFGYALAAIVVGSLFAWWMGRRITLRLYAVQQTIDRVRSGDRGARSNLRGTDEAAVIAREFNAMLDALAEHEQERHFGEQRYRSLIRKVHTAIVVHDSQGRAVNGNPFALQLLGLSEDQLLGKSLTDPHWSFLREDGSILPISEYPAAQVLASNEPIRGLVVGIDCPERAAITWVLGNAEPEFDDAGKLAQVIVSFVDISERRRNEQALHRLNRELRALSDCNEAMMRAVDERMLLNNICHTICDQAGYRMAWVGYPSDDEAKTIRAVAWAGYEAGYLAQAKLSWADSELGRGPSGTAVRTGCPVCIQDFAADPAAWPWRENALQRGFRSSIALPLKDESGAVFGILNIYADQPYAFDSEEVRLLEELAGDLAFGIVALRERLERKRAEEALRISEQKLIEASRIAHVGYWERDFVTDRIALSPEACRIFGLSETFGSSHLAEWQQLWLALIHPDDRATIADTAARALTGEAGYDLEYRIVRPDGVERIAHSNANVTRDETGRPLRMFATIIDITERKQAEQERLSHLWFLEGMDRVNRAIQSSGLLDRMLADVLENTLAIFQCDRVYLIHPCDLDTAVWTVYMEKTRPEHPGAYAAGTVGPVDDATRMLRKQLLEVEGALPFGDHTSRPLPPEMAERFGIQSMLAMMLRPKLGKPWQLGLQQCTEQRLWNPDEIRLFEEIGRRLTDGLTSLISHRDLLESEAEYRRIVNTATEGIWTLGPDSLTTFVNRPMAAMLGYEETEIIGHPVTDFLLPEDVPDHLLKLDNRGHGVSEHYERRFRRKDGGTVWTLASTASIFDDEHRFKGNLAMFTDITERKRIDEEIRRLNQELERRVMERTVELEAANQELEAFAYSVSHDLRAPLRHIDGFLGLLKKRIAPSLDDESRRYIATVSAAALRMAALIDDLLSFSRMGRVELARAPVDLNALVQDVLRELEPDTQGRAIAWHLAQLPEVIGDRAMLRIVLVNLIANAVKFSQPRQLAEIEVGTVPAQDEVIVFVRDNGVGFDMQYVGKLFGVFQRLHGVDEFEGTGIGLANVRRIIHRHGGRTWAEGRLDGGAT